MAPDTSWSDQFTKSEKQMDLKGLGWKNLIKECLMKTEALRSSNENYLNPFEIMDVRHKMVKSSRRIFPIPREQIQTEALKVLREETSTRLMKQKQGQIVEKEIERLKQILEKHRQLSRKQLEEAVSEKVRNVKPAAPKFAERHTRLWRRFESYEVDTWVNQSVRVTMEAKMSERGVPIDVEGPMKRTTEPEEELQEPVSCNRKGSVADDEDEAAFSSSGEDDEKSEIMRRFFEKVDSRESNSCEDRRIVENAWKTWKRFTLEQRKRKTEQMVYENKIDAFLAKLQDAEGEVKTRSKSCDHQSKQSRIAPKQRAKTAEEKKKEIIQRGVEQQKKLHQLMRDVKESQTEVRQKLRAIERSSDRVKVLQKLAGVFEEVDRKVPTFILRMEARREERMKRREEIEERKRKLEEEKENAQRKRGEEEKLKEEEEKRKKRQKLQEKRRLEKEKKEEQRREKAKSRLADLHHRTLLLRSYGLRPWLKLIRLKDDLQIRAITFCERRLLRKAFHGWRTNARSRTERKLATAESFRATVLQRKCFLKWAQSREESTRQIQVAVDWNDFRLTMRAFQKWLRFTEEEQLEYLTKKEVAALNHEARLKKKYLKKWREYPELKRLETVKENRKRMWRQRVKEILPDYQPIANPDDF